MIRWWTGALAVAAVTAVAVTVAGLLRPAPTDPLAPGLAALSGSDLSELLPAPTDFPTGWTVKQSPAPSDVFGYHSGNHPFDPYTPPECFALVQGTWSSDGFAAAGVVGNDPVEAAVFANSQGVRLAISRDFHPALLADQRALVSRCAQFTEHGSDYVARHAVTVLEDTPARFSYAVTRAVAAEPDDKARTDSYAYAPLAGLLLTGHAAPGHEAVLDGLFAATLDRIAAR